MGKFSQVQWTRHTWNPWHGCRKVSAGCKYCYMYRDKFKYGQDASVVKRSATKFYEPLKWSEPALVFTCSWSDWFIEEADAWRAEAWAIIKDTPHLTYQILTKRPERIAELLPADWGEGYDNVWLGVSVENQEAANVRIPILLGIPAKVRFLSMEPLLEQVWIELIDGALYDGGMPFAHQRLNGDGIGWVILGGESGNDNGLYRYRPMQMAWAQSIIEQCTEANVPVFVKQLGTHLAKELHLSDRHGGNMEEWPNEYQIRQFPKQYQPAR